MSSELKYNTVIPSDLQIQNLDNIRTNRGVQKTFSLIRLNMSSPSRGAFETKEYVGTYENMDQMVGFIIYHMQQFGSRYVLEIQGSYFKEAKVIPLIVNIFQKAKNKNLFGSDDELGKILCFNIYPSLEGNDHLYYFGRLLAANLKYYFADKIKTYNLPS